MLQPDMGTTIVMAILTGSVLFVGGIRCRHLAVVVGSGFSAGAVPGRRRALPAGPAPVVHRPRSPHAQDGGYQVAQSLIALGSGGWTGVGLGAGRAKWLFLPNAHTDFIFAIIGEELGLVGCALVLVLFGALAVLGIRTALRAPDRFGSLLAAGITGWVVGQAIVNVGAVTGAAAGHRRAAAVRVVRRDRPSSSPWRRRCAAQRRPAGPVRTSASAICAHHGGRDGRPRVPGPGPGRGAGGRGARPGVDPLGRQRREPGGDGRAGRRLHHRRSCPAGVSQRRLTVGERLGAGRSRPAPFSMAMRDRAADEAARSWSAWAATPRCPASWPPALLRVPTVVHEQNAAPGLANRIAVRLGARAAVSLPGTPLRDAVVTGNPVRAAVIGVERRPSATRPLVAVFGGSLGARRLNEAAAELYDLWRGRADVTVHHVSGAAGHAAAEAAWRRAGRRSGDASTTGSSATRTGMPELYAVTSLAVCRAGATTVAELAAAGVPSVLGPAAGRARRPPDPQRRGAGRRRRGGAGPRRRVHRRPPRRRAGAAARRPRPAGEDGGRRPDTGPPRSRRRPGGLVEAAAAAGPSASTAAPMATPSPAASTEARREPRPERSPAASTSWGSAGWP